MFIKNFSYMLMANIVGIIASTLITFLLPKYLNLNSFAYFQLFWFYINFSGLIHLGWTDGIFLRFGGTNFYQLFKGKIKTQIIVFMSIQFLITLFACLIVIFNIKFMEKEIWISIFLAWFAINYRYFFQYILMTGNKFKQYAESVFIEKFLHIVLIVTLLFLKVNSFMPYIIVSIISFLSAAFYSTYSCKEVFLTKHSPISKELKEILENIKAGSKLMITSTSNYSINGVIRVAIERSWNLIVFSQISLTLALSNFLMSFIGSISTVLFPELRRLENKRLFSLYKKIDISLLLVFLVAMNLYYPLKVILLIWLPQYSVSIMFMAILFPILVYDGKMNLLVSTYFKALRLESSLMYINLFSVVISLVLAYISTVIFRDLTISLFMIVLVLGIRCIFSEIILLKSLHLKNAKNIIVENIMVIFFIISNYFIGDLMGMILFFLFSLTCIFFYKDIIKELFQYLYKLLLIKGYVM